MTKLDRRRTEKNARLFDSIDDAIRAFRAGRIVVITDDEQRENEGDLVLAAEKATPSALAFMAKNGRGLVCIAMTRERLAQIGLSRMNTRGDGSPYKTAFMESVDAREGITTGISAFDRAHTIRLLASPTSKISDFVSPGHVFPLEAVQGGILRRPGHTEASVDMARMAGLQPAGVICEVLRDDGRMARLPDLRRFARKHKLPLISVADLIAYRRLQEKLVHRDRTVRLPTEFGTFQLHMYTSAIDGQQHLALVRGRPARRPAALVRVHSECLTGDVFGSLRCDCGTQLREALRRIAEEGDGVLVYLRQEGRGIGLAGKIHAYALQEKGLDTVQANQKLGYADDARDYSTGAQILADLGLSRLRLLTNNPRKITGIERYGLEIVERLPLVCPATQHNAKYLRTKRQKLGHLL